MENKIISEGRTTAEAIEKGLKKLNISKSEAEIKVLEEKKKSFFSILDPHIVKVEISVKEGAIRKEEKNEVKAEDKEKKKIETNDLERVKEKLNSFLAEFLEKISSNISYKITDENGVYINVEIQGEDSGKLIGYRGEALNSLQLILSNIANNTIDSSVKVIVDIENYREKRKKTLEELASKIEKTVTRTGKKITLEPMSPFERKVIHTKLQESDTVRTYSIGEDSNRRVVICKK